MEINALFSGINGAQTPLGASLVHLVVLTVLPTAKSELHVYNETSNLVNFVVMSLT